MTERFFRRIGLTLLLILPLLLGACSNTDQEVVPGSQQSSPSSGGQSPVVTTQRFAVTARPTEVFAEGDDVYVPYWVAVESIAPQSLRGFTVALVFKDELDAYFAAGITPLATTPVDLSPIEGSGASRGVELSSDQLVADPQFLAESELNPSRILELGREVTVWLRWDGGEEKIDITFPISDPRGLLSP